MSVRVYVPSTPHRLRAVLDAEAVGPAPFAAHAVTAEVCAQLPDAGEEDREYAAATAAAQASVALLDVDEPALRVVLAVDVAVDVAAVLVAGDGADPTLVRVDEAVPLRRVAAVLADSAEAGPAVAAARDALIGRSPEAERRLDLCLDHELGWWAAQELGELVEITGSGDLGGAAPV